MAATITPCRICGDRDSEYFQLDGIQALANAISRGDDLGGVFELGEALAKARLATGIGDGVATAESHRAVAAVLTAQAKVAAEFNRLVGRRSPCRLCKLRETLAFLSRVAFEAVADERQGVAPAGYVQPLVDACRDLAGYAGDQFPDEDATRTVLDRARDVFLTALASVSPERGPQ